MTIPNCPECGSTYVYEDRGMYNCPECSYEFSINAEAEESNQPIIKDSNGNQLTDGDTVTVIKDLKVKGSATALKKGTTIKNIRLLDQPVNGHDVDCKIDGFGSMQLKSEFLKKI